MVSLRIWQVFSAIFLIIFLIPEVTLPATKRTDFFHPFFNGNLKAKVVIVEPKFEGNIQPKADIIFLTGYYDRPDNHIPLFESWANSGFRVISFAYPSHDENSGPLNFLSLYSFSGIYKMLIEIEKATNQNSATPLILSGWSLGGEVIIRAAQTRVIDRLSRPVQALVALDPSVAVKPVVGERGIATRRTLTGNTEYPFGGPLKPISPLIHLPFTSSLILNSMLSFAQTLPKDLPVLVLTAGDNQYVSPAGVARWIQGQRKRGVAQIEHQHFEGARHMLEADESAAVQEITGEFHKRICAGILRGVH